MQFEQAKLDNTAAAERARELSSQLTEIRPDAINSKYGAERASALSPSALREIVNWCQLSALDLAGADRNAAEKNDAVVFADAARSLKALANAADAA